MAVKYKDMMMAMQAMAEENNISLDMVKEAICEAMAIAYKKEEGLQEISVHVEINDKEKGFDLFQNYTVVDEVMDDEIEISLKDVQAVKPDAQLGDTISRKIDINIDDLSRLAANQAKSVLNQKIKEASKLAVYNEYKDLINEMVIGVVESVRDRFALINLGRTIAMMPAFQQNPLEHLQEGQQIRVVIVGVKAESKGSQVVVSRADPMLVKRLFEKEVPEIYNGVVEIKAIAREAGERTKMAVISHNPDVDPIGACIGPRGQRVQNIIQEIHGEKIDIFQWSDDITELVKNALAPAVVQTVLPGKDDHSLIVVVDEDQLSLAIGKRGKNARLAVKLTDYKIDIKTRAELEENGYDYEAMVQEAEEKRRERMAALEEKEKARKQAEAREAEAKRMAKLQELGESNPEVEYEEDGFIPEEMQDAVSEKVINDMSMEAEEPAEEAEKAEEPAEEIEASAETQREETESKETETVSETAAETDEESGEESLDMKQTETKAPKHKHADLEEMAEKNTYVSRFEKLTDTSSNKKNDNRPKRRKKRNDNEDNYKIDNKELEKQIKAKLSNTAASKPVYTEEELEEIEAERQAEEDRELGIDDDFDEDEEYDDYYDDEEK